MKEFILTSTITISSEDLEKKPKAMPRQLGHVGKIGIGFWRSELESDLPMPKSRESAWVGKTTFVGNLAELQRIAKVEAYKGFSMCRLCNKPNGNKEYYHGKFFWPEGLLHYVNVHNVKPPKEFITYVINKEWNNAD